MRATGMKDTRRTRPSKSTIQGTYDLTETELLTDLTRKSHTSQIPERTQEVNIKVS